VEQKHGLARLFKNSLAEVLDFLLVFDGYDYSKSEIARNSGVGHKTIYDVWPVLEELDLVKQTRTVGRAKMYRINKDNPLAMRLHDLQQDLLLETLDVKELAVAKSLRK
jgi:predicted AAA+ superfamily ATPase